MHREPDFECVEREWDGDWVVSLLCEITAHMHKAIKIGLAISIGVFLVYNGLVGKHIGATGLFWDVFFLIPPIFLIALPFIAAIFEKDKRRRIFLLAFGLVFACGSIAFVGIPQTTIARFYYKVKNHTELNNLKPDEVAYIRVDDITLDKPEQIDAIVKTLNNSMWYSPNHERRGKDVPMTIVLQSKQIMYFRVSYFDSENAADLLFIRPQPSGFLADGDAYVSELPSTLQSLGFSLVPEH